VGEPALSRGFKTGRLRQRERRGPQKKSWKRAGGCKNAGKVGDNKPTLKGTKRGSHSTGGGARESVEGFNISTRGREPVVKGRSGIILADHGGRGGGKRKGGEGKGSLEGKGPAGIFLLEKCRGEENARLKDRRGANRGEKLKREERKDQKRAV